MPNQFIVIALPMDVAPRLRKKSSSTDTPACARLLTAMVSTTPAFILKVETAEKDFFIGLLGSRHHAASSEWSPNLKLTQSLFSLDFLLFDDNLSVGKSTPHPDFPNIYGFPQSSSDHSAFLCRQARPDYLHG
jgi:hypothetical protein